MNERAPFSGRIGQFGGGIAEELLQARSEDQSIGGNVEFPGARVDVGQLLPEHRQLHQPVGALVRRRPCVGDLHIDQENNQRQQRACNEQRQQQPDPGGSE